MSNLTKFCLRVVLGFLCFVLPAMPLVSAESLWVDNGPGANLYSDHKARAVGDTITIVIRENTSAKRVGSSANTKSSSTSMNAGVGIFSGITAASAGNSDKFSAAGSITNSNVVTARMTAQVTEVKPNGSLVILGKQNIEQNGEGQIITVSGVVRVEDIAPDNTVLSSSIGDAQIKIDGKGPIARKQRQGIISQLLNIFF